MRLLICLFLMVLFGVSSANQFCRAIQGAAIVAQDGTFLGTVSSSFNQDSIFNEFGPHGNEFSSTSIWNEFSQYGGEFSTYSPFNEFTSSPPLIIINNRPAAKLSVSQTDPSAVHPYALKQCRF